MVKSRVQGSQVLRSVLSFTLRHWADRKSLVVGIALAMVLATLTEVVVPVYAGRLVDALASGRSAAGAALSAFLVMMALGTGDGGAAPFRLVGHRAAHAEHHAQGRAGRVSSRAAVLDRLAQQQFRRLHRAQDHARHVGARHASTMCCCSRCCRRWSCWLARCCCSGIAGRSWAW